MHHGTATGFETLTTALLHRFADNPDRPEESLRVNDIKQLDDACTDGQPRQLQLRLDDDPSVALDDQWFHQLAQSLPVGCQLLLDLPSTAANGVIETLSGPKKPWTVLRQAGFLDLSDPGFARQICQHSPTTPEHWLRVISWVASDQRLHALVTLLEQQLFAHCPTPICPRIWLLLGSTASTAAPARHLDTSGDIGAFLGPDTVATLNSLMGSMRCRVLWYRLSALLLNVHGIHLDSLLDHEHIAVLDRWRQLEQQDSDNIAITRSWYQSTDLAPLLEYKGISLGATREYDLFSLLLTQYYREQPVGKS